MSYGSNEWHRKQGEAIHEHERKIAAGQLHEELDEKALEELEPGMSVKAPAGNGEEIHGFVLEIYDGKVTVENYENCVTVEPRKVTIKDE